ncbi:hypothetical protein E3P92_04128 [Wallemia ichthyophaga]|uniref:Gfo/Idh/MocA-like oxidoreductase N-terminal domain-containing protein n=2 Tax=Wallemia ichthyophaga TaxID=245174 RepID=A0A4T0E366_WALIC|nr:uncharacterized protein J056_000110 [Wallemia ichthyophaga EXF-994]TIA68160.1 hypothetical protein E3P91_04158 [Wallemia ichthyophaga]EOR04590.1 hypothetical protein J056_000110 [Wallemia ichthyophaga EXF-994]TIA77598.1 hypothetical protein E3P98_04129 [Wallemia ichthyophaga]TIA86804.1 hypothetical protein E3P97_04129 [Wallemia ichthyophaga]TIA94670.1 hypothetical protein E3P95_04136 [Wallemia ichthyophaga]
MAPQKHRRSSIEANPLQSGPQFNLIYVGAGAINFGTDEGPWNHSKRVEQKWGKRLNVVGIVDPNTAKADLELSKKRESFVADAYKNTKTFPTVAAARKELEGESFPHAIIVGAPPKFRGGLRTPADLELSILEHFPKVAMFIEKPVTTGPSEEAGEVGKRIAKTGNPVAVGYMLRYSKAVQAMIGLIEEKNLTVMCTSARYVMAYEKAVNIDWWDKSISCGPIVEQATHFCDLSRYFGGDVKLDSVQAHSVEWDEEPGQLSKQNIDESKVPAEQRIPRFTSASWKYTNGTVGSLIHGVALHDTDYYTELTVFADGYLLRLVDPYNNPTLYVRSPNSNAEKVQTFTNDDCFYSEISNWGDEIERQAEHKDEPIDHTILSSYEDAVKTYEFTWAIRLASERSRQ